MNTDNFYAAMADSVRRRLLALLISEDEVCVCELVGALVLPQPKVSRHLGLLRDAGIVSVRRVGTWIFYRLSPRMPLWAYKTIELMVQGETGNAVFEDDADRLGHRPVGYAEINLTERKEKCEPCRSAEVAVESTTH